MSNILEQANKIINQRSEEKERQYGPMGEGFERAALIASGMSGKEWSAHDMFIAMVALKFSRQSYNFKEDNLLDAVAYIGAWQNYINDSKPDHAGPDSPADVSSTKNYGEFSLDNSPTDTRFKNEKSKKELLTETTTSELFEDEDTQDAPPAIAQSPYTTTATDPRALIKALAKLGEQQ